MNEKQLKKLMTDEIFFDKKETKELINKTQIFIRKAQQILNNQ